MGKDEVYAHETRPGCRGSGALLRRDRSGADALTAAGYARKARGFNDFNRHTPGNDDVPG